MEKKILLIMLVVLILCVVLSFVNFLLVYLYLPLMTDISSRLRGHPQEREQEIIVGEERKLGKPLGFTIYEEECVGDTVTFERNTEKTLSLSPEEFHKTAQWLGIDKKDIPSFQREIRKIYDKNLPQEQKKELIDKFFKDLKDALRKAQDRKMERLLQSIEKEIEKEYGK